MERVAVMPASMRRTVLALALAAAGLGFAEGVGARRVVVAFGDSITKGGDAFDEEGKGGYPGRLEPMLRQHAGFEDVVVINAGLGGERTDQGVTRIDSVLDSVSGDEVLSVIIMEGTNDVNEIVNGKVSVESVVSNLATMANKVANRGWPSLYSTVIPRLSSAKKDSNNKVTFSLVVAIREHTSSGNRPTGEPWEVFFFTPNREGTIYHKGNDPVGHPNAAGFALLSRTFRDKLINVDSLGPVFSGFDKSGSQSSLNVGDQMTALLHESGSGINLGNTFFTINDQQISTQVAGDAQRAQLSASVPDTDFRSSANVVIHTQDGAGNVRDIPVASFSSASSSQGDVNNDGRVDGVDLVLFGLCFGSSSGDARYSPACDFNGDGQVNDSDLQILESNFGS